MSWFGEPTLRYSYDGGKTWHRDGPRIGPNLLLQVVTSDGKILFSATAREYEKECESCNGTGKVKRHLYVEDVKG
jgi:hypothetical protein